MGELFEVSASRREVWPSCCKVLAFQAVDLRTVAVRVRVRRGLWGHRDTEVRLVASLSGTWFWAATGIELHLAPAVVWSGLHYALERGP